MITTPYELRNYRKLDGTEPFEEWHTALDGSLRPRVDARLALVRAGSLGETRHVGEGVYELKFKIGLRVYYAQIGRQLLLLFCGSGKSDQKAEIKSAKEYWSDYQERQRKDSNGQE